MTNEEENGLKFSGNVKKITINVDSEIDKPSAIKVEFNIPSSYLEVFMAMQLIRNVEVKFKFKTANSEGSWLGVIGPIVTVDPEGWRMTIKSSLQQMEWFLPIISMGKNPIDVTVDLLARD